MSVRRGLSLCALLLAVLGASALMWLQARDARASFRQERPGDTTLALQPPATDRIWNIKLFLEDCPANDPAYATIRADFQLRRNGVIVGDVPCAPPISRLAIARYTDELIVLQGLRTIYHMDQGQSGHLPWTPGTLYAWMRSKIGGIDIRTDVASSFCCETFAGRLAIVVSAQDDFNRDFDRTWKGISDNIALYAHETRHVDGFGHTSGCGVANGCDPTFDAANLSPFGIQYWLTRSYLNGAINVGFACAPPAEVIDIAQWHQATADGYRTRFDQAKPPALVMPAQPGGVCSARAILPMIARTSQ